MEVYKEWREMSEIHSSNVVNQKNQSWMHTHHLISTHKHFSFIIFINKRIHIMLCPHEVIYSNQRQTILLYWSQYHKLVKKIRKSQKRRMTYCRSIFGQTCTSRTRKQKRSRRCDGNKFIKVNNNTELCYSMNRTKWAHVNMLF